MVSDSLTNTEKTCNDLLLLLYVYIVTSNIPGGTVAKLTPSAQAAPGVKGMWGPVESNAGVGDRDRSA